MRPTILREYQYFGDVWFELLELLCAASTTYPRGQQVYELTGVTLYLPEALNNTFVCPQRNLQYRFQVAEWLWIWFGRNDVASVSRYNKHIAQFSDNGKTFNGAYGPPFRQQYPRVRRLLTIDPDTRQAVIQIYQPPWTETRDVPCTLALQFLIRDGKLDTIATMRSSDVWLGLPYDVFNFTMLANCLAADLSRPLGDFTIHLGSSHLYEVNRAAAWKVLQAHEVRPLRSPQLTGLPDPPLEQVLETGELLEFSLSAQWQRYAQLLCAKSNAEARTWLEEVCRG